MSGAEEDWVQPFIVFSKDTRTSPGTRLLQLSVLWLAGSPLPEARHAIAVEHAVVAGDWQILQLCLRDEHTVERVPMLARKTPGALGMENGDIEARESLAGHTARNVCCDIERARQLAESRLSGQPPVPVEPPEECVRVKEQPHLTRPSP